MEQLKENLSLLSAALLLAALIKINIYYRYFGINIMSYIDISESLTLTIPFMLKIAVFAAINMLADVFKYTGALVEVMEDRTKNLQVSMTLRERFKMYYGPQQIMFGLILPILMLAVYVYLFLIHKPGTDGLLVTFIFFFTITNYRVYIYEFTLAYQSRYGKPMDSLTSIVARITPLVVIYITIMSYNDASNAIHNTNYTKVEISTEKINIKSSNTYRFVGQTKNYAFFYNTKTGTSDAYNTSGLKFISSKE